MAKTLNDDDIEAVATRLLEIVVERLTQPKLTAIEPGPSPEPPKALPPKLTFTLKELSQELGISRASIYRLNARGLLKPLPYLRTKIYARTEVERFLKEGGRSIM